MGTSESSHAGASRPQVQGAPLKLRQWPRPAKVAKDRASLIPRYTNSSLLYQKYELGVDLFKSPTSKVQFLRDKRTGADRVLKISQCGAGMKNSEMLRNEIHFLMALDHPSIVQMYEFCEDVSRGQLLMVLDYVGCMDCRRLQHPRSEAFIGKIMQQVLSALGYCHTRGVMHCDVKPENMMLTVRQDAEVPDCKLIDFGLSQRIDNPAPITIGTTSYIAPEVVKGSYPYTVKADMWSIGVTACELLAAKTPFGSPADFDGNDEPVFLNIRCYQKFQEIERRLSSSQIWGSRSDCVKNFVQSIIIADHAARPYAHQALEHIWLSKNEQRQNQKHGMISSDMLQSMARFVRTSPLTRRYLLIIAARLGSEDMDAIGRVFLSIDHDHTGHISREELAETVDAAVSFWRPEIDVDDYFDAADQDGRGVITFLEFAATCLWGPDDTSAAIAERAFKALDDNWDGRVSLNECRYLFRDCDLIELQNASSSESWGVDAWRTENPGSIKQPEGAYVAEYPVSSYQWVSSAAPPCRGPARAPGVWQGGPCAPVVLGVTPHGGQAGVPVAMLCRVGQ